MLTLPVDPDAVVGQKASSGDLLHIVGGGSGGSGIPRLDGALGVGHGGERSVPIDPGVFG